MGAELQVFINGLEDGVVLIDRSYLIEQVNEAIRLKVIGNNTPIIGRPCCEVLPCHQDPRLQTDNGCPALQVFRTQQPQRMTHLCNIGGMPTWMDIVASPLLAPDGTVERVVEVWRDVTQLKHLEESYQRRVQELSALRLISEVSSQSLSMRKILDDSLALVLEILRADAGGIYLLDAEAKVLRLRAYRSISTEIAQDIDFLKLGEGFSGKVVESGHPLIVDDVRTDPRLTRQMLNQANLHSLLAAPLKSHKGILGTIWLALRSTSRRFVPAEADWLSAVGRQLGLAVENAWLYDEMRKRDAERSDLLAYIINAQEDERKRVARDLHDETIQALAALAVSADKLLAQFGPDHPDLGRELSRFKASIWRITDGLHEVITDLRPGLLDDLGLVPAVRWYANNKLEPLGIDIAFDVPDSNLNLAPQQEITLFRVLQEAINNIAQHAEARHVYLSLRLSPAMVTAVVVDDGRGFDPEEVLNVRTGPRGLGLLGMRERLTLIRGQLRIETRPQAGTRLYIEIPLEPAPNQGG